MYSDNFARYSTSAFPCYSSLKSFERSLFQLNHDYASLSTRSYTSKQNATVNYLAYGSNLSRETFLDRRGIRPISQINVFVPSLRLTFDLPGIPYVEPCFANTFRRSPHDSSLNEGPNEKSHLVFRKPEYHKERWHKPLVGVLYTLTSEDYARVIATEGGGAAYHDITIPCYPLAPNSPSVPSEPDQNAKAVVGHTLLAPTPAPPSEPGDPPPKKPPSEGGGRYARPDPNYAQPSSRYLKLITDGAEQHSLPVEYRRYLSQIRSYRATTQGQRLGAFVYGKMWAPIIMFVFQLQSLLKDKDGKSPDWVQVLAGVLFAAVWQSYDGFFFDLFGGGERTIGEGPELAETV